VKKLAQPQLDELNYGGNTSQTRAYGEALVDMIRRHSNLPPAYNAVI